MATRKVEFMGWCETLPERAEKKGQLSEHDILRIVLLAESSPEFKWVEFKCEDEMHAIKAASKLKEFKFRVDVVARADRLYVRRWW